MLDCLLTLLRFLRSRTTANWRAHRRACRALLTAKELAADIEEGK